MHGFWTKTLHLSNANFNASTSSPVPLLVAYNISWKWCLLARCMRFFNCTCRAVTSHVIRAVKHLCRASAKAVVDTGTSEATALNASEFSLPTTVSSSGMSGKKEAGLWPRSCHIKNMSKWFTLKIFNGFVLFNSWLIYIYIQPTHGGTLLLTNQCRLFIQFCCTFLLK